MAIGRRHSAGSLGRADRSSGLFCLSVAQQLLQQLIDAQWDEVRLDAEFAFKHQRRAPEAFTDLVSTTALMLREG